MSTRGSFGPGSRTGGLRTIARTAWLAAGAAGLALALSTSGCRTARPAPVTEPETLPVYRLAVPVVNEPRAADLARRIFGAEGETRRSRAGFSSRAGDDFVELCAVSGGVWAADEAQLWNLQVMPRLPGPAEAVGIATEFLQRAGLRPMDKEPLAVAAVPTVGGSKLAHVELPGGARNDFDLDRAVTWTARVRTGSGEQAREWSVVGGGDEVRVTVGEGGRVIGYSGTWRDVAGVETESRLIPRATADQEFRELTRALKVREFDSTLAYYAAPFGDEQEFLYPVRVYSATADVDGHVVPLRRILLPATEFGPKPKVPPPPPARTDRDTPMRRATEPEGPEEHGSDGSQYILGMPPPGARASWMECGASYIGLSGGLSGSAANAAGFVSELQSDAWTRNFQWGDAAAWESDWRVHDDEWVDTADFVFYTGHASLDGWVLSRPDDSWLDASEVGGNVPRDLWGSQDCEWIVVAASGPLQDDAISPGGGDVFRRWGGAFDGLHQLLGYGAITYDNEDEGKRVVQYVRDGQTLLHAWFRAAQEIQPSTNGALAPDGPDVWVGVMYPTRTGGGDVGADHIWGAGVVAPDPVPNDGWVAIWSTT